MSIPYKIVDGEPLFCVFHRAYPDIWQFISGGGEDDEQTLETAYREVWEESGIRAKEIIPLVTHAHLPAAYIDPYYRQGWSVPTYVIPEHTFAFETDEEPTLSEEHTEYRWLPFREARQILRFDSNKVAMYEVLCRIKGGTTPPEMNNAKENRLFQTEQAVCLILNYSATKGTRAT